MSERKVLNKYYPPDYDPSNIPKLRLPRNRQFSIRIMVPFNCRCNLCGDYIYKGKKFNSRSELVENENYLGIQIRRFYIRCPKCVAEIAFKTDPQNADYTLEAGATRNFEPMKTAEEMAKREIKEKEDEEANNPMKVLENRTKASRQEMDMLETLEELKELNTRHAKVDHESMITLVQAYEKQLKQLMEEEDEKFVTSLFGKGEDNIKRLKDDDEDEAQTVKAKKLKPSKMDKPTDLLTSGDSDPKSTQSTSRQPAPRQKSIGGMSTTKKSLAMLVKKKDNGGKQKNSNTYTKLDKPKQETVGAPSREKDESSKSDESPKDGASKTDESCKSDESSRGDESAGKGDKSSNVTVTQTAVSGVKHETEPTTDKIVPDKFEIVQESKQSSAVTISGSSALGLLGGYADSDSSSNDSE